MKVKKSVLPPFILAGSVGLGGTALAWEHNPKQISEFPSERYPTSIEDDQSMAPGVPGITENNTSDMSRRQVQAVQRALEAEGFDPGRSDGSMDNNTRAAIRDFQRNNELVVTGTVDRQTAEVLGVHAASDLSG